MEVAKVPLLRTLIFGHSLGTAVNLAVAEYFALQSPPVAFAGHILVAPFADATTLMVTYQIAGIVPLVGPVANLFPPLFYYLKRYLIHKWSSKDRIVRYIRIKQTAFRIKL